MKKNSYNRRVRALDRLSTQISSRRVSTEFTVKIQALTDKEKEEELRSYWDRKQKELEHLATKIG